MPDPFDVLAELPPAADPSLAFAARLRSRLERALDLPRGVTVSDLTIESEVPAVTAAGPSPTLSGGRAQVIPYLAVAGARDALQWYADALGARVKGQPIVMPDGRIGHAELDLSGAAIMLSDEHPDIGVSAPAAGRGVPVSIHLSVPSVDDVDGLIARAVEAGAELTRAPADHDYGRNGVIVDPFGHRWLISAPPPAPAGRVRPGDLAYASLWVPDAGRAAGFFSSVLGWRFESRGGAHPSRQVEGHGLHHGLLGGNVPSTLFLCFAVADVAAAAERVRRAGGTATEPHEEPFGLISDCVDNQGVPLALYEVAGAPEGGASGNEPGLRLTAHGDLAYVTMEVLDSARARDFYGSVLGWTFAAGRVPDGWQVEGDVVPPIGLAGGHDVAVNVPMYRVDDIATAVERVREQGGTATDPERQPYGISSVCADDQGTRFYLGQL
jgi:uncharacterized glyoxalase superfamily protein PhnB/catechol 2,3-dioxygenase-like lactoylglutathione lyase family enzyme